MNEPKNSCKSQRQDVGQYTQTCDSMFVIFLSRFATLLLFLFYFSSSSGGRNVVIRRQAKYVCMNDKVMNFARRSWRKYDDN